MMPIQRLDGSFIPGMKEDDMSNFDHSPFYIEDHSNACWGLKESTERRCILTGGKKKDRFTAQLTIFMSGRKVCVYDFFSEQKTRFVHQHTLTHCCLFILGRANHTSSSRQSHVQRGNFVVVRERLPTRYITISQTGGEIVTQTRPSVTSRCRQRQTRAVS